ncbi:MAG: hypothetical protein NTW31_04020 [Bacteroidetes bacterium]|nr:hypothetical protein [Bacteroidota bacterium]
MRKLSLISLLLPVFLLLTLRLIADSPHGKDFKLSCDLCHSSKGWTFDKSVYAFDHNKTAMPLVGQHQVINCRQCHKSLVFSEAKTACVDCHTDMHYQTVGPDCGRCHTSKSWIVENITEMHQKSRFPLVGPHYTSDCSRCHPSASLLRFEPQGVECYDCHAKDYQGATKPNHVTGGYSKNCSECHSLFGFTWTTTNINHDFFPLTNGHAIGDCGQCHVNGNYTNISKECVSCHQANYNATTNPNHITASFPTSCIDCHTTNPGWKPATYTAHDAQFFPVYSGKHAGTWSACAECHTTPGSLKTFSCIDCHAHNQPDMDSKHNGVGGYSYASLPCYECHPTGSVSGAFNHNNGGFPLTGAHLTTPCSSCHSNGFAGTPTDCSACHQANYNATTNPNHPAKNIPNTCATCHTTAPGWKPATFAIHGNYYALTGAHTTVACVNCHNGNYTTTPNTCVGCHQANYSATTNPNHISLGIPNSCNTCHTTTPGWKPATFPIHNNYYVLQGAHTTLSCVACHNGIYNNTTPTTCVGCHQSNYNATTNPNHLAAGFPTDCASCHSQTAWTPSTFNHDGAYFPIYSGKHKSAWSLCSDCHPTASNFQVYTCTTSCHPQSSMDNHHQGVSGYSYTSSACYSCHPTGNAGKMIQRQNNSLRKE